MNKPMLKNDYLLLQPMLLVSKFKPKLPPFFSFFFNEYLETYSKISLASGCPEHHNNSVV